jgi:hypothetical protein
MSTKSSINVVRMRDHSIKRQIQTLHKRLIKELCALERLEVSSLGYNAKKSYGMARMYLIGSLTEIEKLSDF